MFTISPTDASRGPNAGPEWLVGEITAAYVSALQRGPVRIEFTDQRVIAIPTLAPDRPAGGTFWSRWNPNVAYRAWRSSVPPGPVCVLVGRPYANASGTIREEFPNHEVGLLRVSREIGIGTDPTVSQLMIGNMRQGWQFGDKPGLPAHSPGIKLPLILRVPASVDELRNLILKTPVAGVLAR